MLSRSSIIQYNDSDESIKKTKSTQYFSKKNIKECYAEKLSCVHYTHTLAHYIVLFYALSLLDSSRFPLVSSAFM